jgi:hypothetical protein
MTAEHVRWLRVLVSSYDTEHDWDGDADPSATLEMLGACRAAVEELAQKYPQCGRCMGDADGPDGLCAECRREFVPASDPF